MIDIRIKASRSEMMRDLMKATFGDKAKTEIGMAAFETALMKCPDVRLAARIFMDAGAAMAATFPNDVRIEGKIMKTPLAPASAAIVFVESTCTEYEASVFAGIVAKCAKCPVFDEYCGMAYWAGALHVITGKAEVVKL